MSTNIDLISLIYEYNPESPLFARVAQKMIDSGEIEKAKEVLDKGIKRFPVYATPYFVYSKLYRKTGDNDMAVRMAEKGNEILNDADSLSFYSAANGDEEKPAIVSTESSAKSYNENELDSIMTQFGEVFFEGEDEEPEEETPKAPVSNKIISETLANIHYSQGHFKEALEIYELLIEKNPDRAEFYSGKIEEINLKLKEQK